MGSGLILLVPSVPCLPRASASSLPCGATLGSCTSCLTSLACRGLPGLPAWEAAERQSWIRQRGHPGSPEELRLPCVPEGLGC